MTEKNNNSEQWIKFLSKIVITVAVGAILTSIPAMITGATTYLIADTIKDNVEDEEIKEVFSFISDCGRDVAFGGVVGDSVNCLIGISSSSLASQSTKYLGKEASKEIAVNGMTTTSKTLITTGKVISTVQKNVDGASKIIEIGTNYLKMIKHQKHLKEGINYLKGCEICNE